MNGATKNNVGALMMAAAGFLFWAFVVATYGQIPQYNRAIEERRATLASRQAILDKIDKMYADYQKRRSDVQLLSFAVPTKRDVENLIVAADAVALQSGMKLSSIFAAEEKNIAGQEAGSLTNVGMELSLTGSYQGLLTLLAGLEQNIRIIDVLSISMSQKESGVIDMLLKTRAYLVK